MRRLLIGSLVGGLILFVWQFLSWSVTGIHAREMQHAPNQDAILQSLSQNLEEGDYFLPMPPADASPAEQREAMASGVGKPWAMVSYRARMDDNMGMNMFRGFAADFVAAFLFGWLLLRFARLDLQSAVLAGLAVGATGFLTISYLNSIWFDRSSIGQLLDSLVEWGAVGAWMGWWLRERPTMTKPM
jgi:hypothetical protein